MRTTAFAVCLGMTIAVASYWPVYSRFRTLALKIAILLDLVACFFLARAALSVWTYHEAPPLHAAASTVVVQTAPPIANFNALSPNAFVGITTIKFEEATNTSPRLRVIVKNFGAPVARHVDVRAYVIVLHYPDADLHDLKEFQGTKPLTRGQFVLAGGQEMGTSFPVDENVIQQLHQLKATYFVRIRISYVEDTKHHRPTIGDYRALTRDGGKSLWFENYGTQSDGG